MEAIESVRRDESGEWTEKQWDFRRNEERPINLRAPLHRQAGT
jgi:hypothetical protein